MITFDKMIFYVCDPLCWILPWTWKSW